MTVPASPRMGLPLLVAAQAHKEITHNEALLLMEAAILPVIEGKRSDPANLGTAPVPGQAWLVDAAAIGAWVGKVNAIAVFTEGGWRFLNPVEPMSVWSRQHDCLIRYSAGTWVEPVQVASPSGGSTVDTEARAALDAVLQQLRLAGHLRP